MNLTGSSSSISTRMQIDDLPNWTINDLSAASQLLITSLSQLICFQEWLKGDGSLP